MTKDDAVTVAAFLERPGVPDAVYFSALRAADYLRDWAAAQDRSPCRWIVQGGGRVLVADADGQQVTLSGLSRLAAYLPDIWRARGAAVTLPLADLSDCPTASRATINAQRTAIAERLHKNGLLVLYGAVCLIRLEREGANIVAWANNAPCIVYD